MSQAKLDYYPVKMENVSKKFSFNGRSATVIDNITLNIMSGELLLLLGPSGSGKTTLLTIMSGLLEYSEGEIILFGKKLSAYSRKEMQRLRASKIGFVFQTFNLIDALTAHENVALSGQFAGMSRGRAGKRAEEIIREMGMDHLTKRYPPTMSQGEKQRIAVARAFINEPEMILADEPTASLESGQGMDIIRLLHDYSRQKNKSVVVVSHDHRICRYADRIIRLQDGKLASEYFDDRSEKTASPGVG